MFNRLSLSELIELCRVLRHYLQSGLTLVEVFAQQARRGSPRVRPVAQRIHAVLQTGSSLEAALQPEAAFFPPLLLSLASVGERTGMLPEVFGDLESYFLRQRQLRREFLARIAWPVTQFVLAIVVLSLLIFIIGQLTPAVGPAGKTYDPLGLGLRGASGAGVFLGVIAGVIGSVVALYFVLSRLLVGRAAFDRFLLGLPALGPCLQALAMSRFCLALRLTHEAGMPIGRALRLSLRGTGNQAFASQVGVVKDSIEAGDDVTLALSRAGVFPEEFLRIVAVAEESGTLTEVLRHQGEHYHEEASRRLAALTGVAGFGVWLLVALFIIVTIFKLYSSYLGLLDSI
jgi:type IV pilus assembly protein PilC